MGACLYSPPTVTPRELPSVDPAYAVIRLALQAHIRTLSRRRGERFIAELRDLLADEELVFPLQANRPAADRADQRRAQRLGANWLQNILPLLVASLPPRD